MTTLWIPPKIFSQLMYYTWKIDAEVGGVGTLEFNWPELNDIYVTEVFLEKQKVHGTECLLSKDESTSEKLILSNEIDKACKLQLWWHSHHTMGVGHSGTDMTTIKECPGEYVVALIINRKGEFCAKMMSKVPVMVIGDIEVRINWCDHEQSETFDAQVEEKVSQQVVAIQQYQNYAQQQWNQMSGEPIQHNTQSGKWSGGKKLNEDEATPLHSMTEAEWVEMEEGYWEEVEKDAKPIDFPVGVMDETEKKALKQIWGEK